jgi:small nuclear ribonucleoprotein
MQKPLNVLNQAINKQVMVELKGNREYHGVLDGYDPHMNLVLKNVEELIGGKVIRKLSITIVRGDNVIFISP